MVCLGLLSIPSLELSLPLNSQANNPHLLFIVYLFIYLFFQIS